MITLLHGDDTVKSRNELQSIRMGAKGKDIRVLDGKGIDDSTLVQALSSSSMFGGDTVVIVESLFSSIGKKLKRSQELASLILAHAQESEIVLWEGKEAGKTVLTALGPKVKVKLFKLPTLIFQFLDNLHPHNAKANILLFQKLVSLEPPELVHVMLVKRVRQLMDLKSGHGNGSLTSWQVSRLTNQSRFFTMDRLVWLYKQLRRLEYERNRGAAVYEMKEAIELVLLSL